MPHAYTRFRLLVELAINALVDEDTLTQEVVSCKKDSVQTHMGENPLRRDPKEDKVLMVRLLRAHIQEL